MTKEEFKITFQALTENPPLRWQERLFDQFAANNLKSVIDLPTGLGKTMVMAIWLIARTQKDSNLPRRLLYVVDRRTVVDQATDLAVKLQEHFGKDKLAISTLRGQKADNREWSRDPSKLAIIIGTVDLIGSALLFSGYRSSYKERPLQAGLLGQDSLLVLDEAHLSKPFEKLIDAIGESGPFQKITDGLKHIRPMRVIKMSATSPDTPPDGTFSLDLGSDNQSGDLLDPKISERFYAKKWLTIRTAEKADATEIANDAILLANDSSLAGKRIVVFVRSPDSATKIADVIRKHEVKQTDDSGKKPKTIATRPFAQSVEVLTGTMRGLERDELVEKPVMRRFLSADDLETSPCFLISTSAGEVGFDLNADHMLCDLSPLDSLIQRLGRVNRRGGEMRSAKIVMLAEIPEQKKDKNGKLMPLEPFQLALKATAELLMAQIQDSNPLDVSPKALRELPKPVEALSPKPLTVELTDILLDAWSMTSIVEPMPGRPEVAPWLRGIDDELPQTTVAWRAELDLPGFDQLDLETIEEWLDTHRVLTHETLSVPTSTAAKWFADRWNKLADDQKNEVGRRSIVVDRAGLQLVTVNEVINQLGRNNTDSIRNADLILPASFGGIERGKGLLDADAPEVPKDESKQSAEDRAKALASRQAAPDVADEHGRYRELVTKTEEGEPNVRPIRSGVKPPNPARFVVELESDDDKRVLLISYVPKRDKPDLGSEPQSLKDHVTRVRYWVDRILGQLSVDEVVKRAAQLAADYHDHGKARERWQRLLVFPKGFIKPNEPMGKSGGEMKRDSRGYRHEFGSLREFIDEHHQKIDQEVFDLAMHLIAVHHGRGRPHFPKGGFDPDCELRSDEIHIESIRRFARLQRKYGWWHLAWLENLLRCADAMASSEQGTVGGAK